MTGDASENGMPGGAVDPEPSCGCAPTRSERTVFGTPSRRVVIGAGVAGAIGIVALAGSGGAGPAYAAIAGYPSWDDVQAARSNEAAKGREIGRIESLIKDLNDRVAATQAESERAAAEYEQTQREFDDAALKAEDLQAQADVQSAIADDASARAARVAAQLYRNGGDDASLQLFFSDSAAEVDDTLTRLGGMDKLVQRNRDIYAAAEQARNNAQQLSDAAADARAERDRLRGLAEAKLVAAQNAAIAAQAALDEQAEYLVVLEAQLAALRDTTARTVADYQAGVEEERRRREEEERRRRAEAERQRQAAEAARRAEEERRQREAAAAAAAASSGGGGGGGGGGNSGGGTAPAPAPGGGGGVPQPSGWARPSWGRITSYFGVRETICVGGYCTSGHRGLDFAAGTGAGIYAAAAGRVSWRGPLDAWGNLVRVEHGNGIMTAYAHMSAFAVGFGQQVSSGQLLGYEGRTGLATGPHLHFEVWQNGVRIDPYGFLRARGVPL